MEASSQAAETGGTEGQSPNLIQRVIMVFVSPGKLGEALTVSSPWFWTVTIAALIGVIAMFFVPMEVWVRMMEASTRGTEGAPDPETAARFGRWAGMGSALVMNYISALIAAGVLYLAFNVVLGQDLKYKQHLSAISHVFWISALGLLLTLPIWISQMDMRVTLGFGLLLPDAPSGFVGHFLNSITLFGLWGTVALGAVESGITGGRVTAGKAISTTMALYLIWVLVKTAQGMFLPGG